VSLACLPASGIVACKACSIVRCMHLAVAADHRSAIINYSSRLMTINAPLAGHLGAYTVPVLAMWRHSQCGLEQLSRPEDAEVRRQPAQPA
jgi:hypothetical protein